MTTIAANQYEIVIREGSWRLVPRGEMLSNDPVFWITRGAGVIEYTPAFGAEHHLPGTVLSIEYVRAVVIGYEEKARCWELGFHLSRSAAEKPRWLELVRWPPGSNELHAAAAQQAGRELAELTGCPLKIFGAKKLPRPVLPDTARTGVTGPLLPHKREDIGPQRVRLFATSVKLPVQYKGIWLGPGKNGVTLRLAKDIAASKGSEAPAFNQCVIDTEQGAIRLIPPTGLLGIFLGGAQGRVIPISDVSNVELRHQISQRHVADRESPKSDLLVENTYTLYRWGVYLTLPDESLLLAQTEHTTSSELSRKRATIGDKFSVDTKAGLEYFRQHQEDQAAYEGAETFARTLAVVIASTLGVHLVKTEVENAH